jgi:tRNA (adenine57-N1/adenine58-N1)-methyltransferase
MDISLIIFKLAVRPGVKVIESGTGRGSLSSSFAQALGEQGRLFTFEFNEDRAKNGEQLLKNLGNFYK